jgi:hypothetical protein
MSSAASLALPTCLRCRNYQWAMCAATMREPGVIRGQ